MMSGLKMDLTIIPSIHPMQMIHAVVAIVIAMMSICLDPNVQKNSA